MKTKTLMKTLWMMKTTKNTFAPAFAAAAVCVCALAAPPAIFAQANLTSGVNQDGTNPLDVTSIYFDTAGNPGSGSFASDASGDYTPYYFNVTFAPDPSANGDTYEIDALSGFNSSDPTTVADTTPNPTTGLAPVEAILYGSNYTVPYPLTVDTSPPAASVTGQDVLEFDIDGTVTPGTTLTGELAIEGQDDTTNTGTTVTVADPDFTFTVPQANTASPAPEPSQMALFACVGLGLGVLMLRARRRLT